MDIPAGVIITVLYRRTSQNSENRWGKYPDGYTSPDKTLLGLDGKLEVHTQIQLHTYNRKEQEEEEQEARQTVRWSLGHELLVNRPFKSGPRVRLHRRRIQLRFSINP